MWFRSDPILKALQIGRWELVCRIGMRNILPYRFGFGVNTEQPERYDLTEPRQLLGLLRELDIKLVNITAGSPLLQSGTSSVRLYIRRRTVINLLRIR